MELTIWVDDIPVSITLEAPDLDLETAFKALYLAGREEVIETLIKQAYGVAEEEENNGKD